MIWAFCVKPSLIEYCFVEKETLLQAGDLVEIIADNTFHGLGLVIEIHDMFIRVRDSRGAVLWYSRSELSPLHACEYVGEFV